MPATARRITPTLLMLWGMAMQAQTIITNYRHYRMSDGLPADKVHCLYQAPDGQLWAGTNGGLCRFDGTKFTTIAIDQGALPVQTITALHSPNDTLLFIGTLGGIAVHNLRTGRFEDACIDAAELKAGTGQEVSGILPLPHGDMLVTAGEYLVILDRHGRTKRSRRSIQDLNAAVLTFRPPVFLAADSSVMLVNKRHTGFCELDLTSLELTPVEGQRPEWQLPMVKDDSYFHAHQLSGQGRYLMGSYWGHHLYFDQVRRTHLRYPIPPMQPGGFPAYPSRVAKDPSDAKVHWVASHFGLRRFSERDLTFSTYLVAASNGDFVATNTFNDLIIDRHGQQWLASNGGLIKLSRLAWLFDDLGFDGQPAYRDVSFGPVVTNAEGRLWVASFDRAIYQVEKGTIPVQLPRWRSNLANGANITFDLRRIDGAVHAATDRGIVRYHEATRRFEDTGWVPDSLLRQEASAVLLHRDARGEWWCSVGRGGGLVRIRPDGQRSVYHHYQRSPDDPRFLPIRYPTVIAEDAQGDLWMGLARPEGMLIRWRRDTERFDTVLVRLDSAQLLRLPITDLLFDGAGNLWVTTFSHGVLRRDAGTGAWTQFTVRDGLRSNDATSAALDTHGNMWVGTFNGIAVLIKGANRFLSFSREEGMPHANIAWLGFPDPARPGMLVITGTGFVQSIDATQLLKPMLPLRATIERVVVEGEPLASHSKGRFAHDQSHFEFHFAAVNLVNGPENRYQYRLEGLEEQWIEAGGLHYANYAQVPPGSYVFQVRAGNASLEWSEPASYAFVVAAPFWQRQWFFLMVACAVGSIIYAVHRARMNRMLAMERVRSHISRDLHDDIGSTLSSISMLAHAGRAGPRGTDPERMQETLQKIGDRTQRTLDNMRDIIWSIKPENDEMANVLARMREHASSTLEAKGIDCAIDFPDDVDGLRLPLELKKNIYLVFKEAVNNLAKYSGASKANLMITIRNGELRMTVEDNGQGFDTSVPGAGNGLVNMERRAKESGAHLLVESSPGKGTRVAFTVPRLP